MRILLSILLLLLPFGVFAQNRHHYPVDSIDEAKLVVYYHYVQQEGGTKGQPLVLSIGKSVVKCCGLYEHRVDSLSYADKDSVYKDPDRALEKLDELQKGLPTTRWKTYRNYPQGKVTITDRVFMDNFRSEIELNHISWMLAPATETKEVLGYKCRKATASFGGREWTAWYAEDIKHPAGPWLLWGLPGLVLEAIDSTKTQYFLAMGIEQTARPILFEDKDYFKSPYKTVLKQQARFYEDTGKYLSGSVFQPKDAKTGKPISYPKRAYNPLWFPEK